MAESTVLIQEICGDGCGMHSGVPSFNLLSTQPSHATDHTVCFQGGADLGAWGPRSKESRTPLKEGIFVTSGISTKVWECLLMTPMRTTGGTKVILLLLA